MEIEPNCCPHGNSVAGDCGQCSPGPLRGIGADVLRGRCCANGFFGQPHACQKGTTAQELTNIIIDRTGETARKPGINGAGIELHKLHSSPGRPKGARNLHAKHPSSISRAFLKAGLNWQTDFALAIKANNGRRIKLWLKLLPYLITQTNHSTSVKRWKGKASKAAMIALQALEGKKQ